ncbi:MAG: hypothetical protein IGQ45_15195 [Cyanobacterium sp. T60_A2020_053]|nr:hypothetical protein [Cyanobacterium sp. T60_A2020_053]
MLITVTYDGKVLKPKDKLNLDTDKEYQIQVIDESSQFYLINELKKSADLYAEIYQEDLDLQQLTEIACEDFIEE